MSIDDYLIEQPEELERGADNEPTTEKKEE